MECTKMQLMKIGECSKLSGCPVRTIHYYEGRGLIDPVSRTESGYRLYGEEEVARLGFIGKAKLLGLTLEEIRELVDMASGCHRGEIMPRLEEVLEEKLRETEKRIRELEAFRESLLYYRRQASGTEPEKSCGDGVSFCGCLEAVTGSVRISDPEIVVKNRSQE
jgi:DNA-binding transcriptional MerR regulator